MKRVNVDDDHDDDAMSERRKKPHLFNMHTKGIRGERERLILNRRKFPHVPFPPIRLPPPPTLYIFIWQDKLWKEVSFKKSLCIYYTLQKMYTSFDDNSLHLKKHSEERYTRTPKKYTKTSYYFIEVWWRWWYYNSKHVYCWNRENSFQFNNWRWRHMHITITYMHAYINQVVKNRHGLFH